MTQDEFRQLLKRYQEGNCSDDELHKLERWFDNISDNDLELTELEKNQVRKRMLNNIRQISDNRGALPPDRWRVWKVAASIAAIALAGYFFVNKQDFVFPTGSASNNHISEALQVIENTSQQTLFHTLPDGSSVELQPGSRISYDDQWTGRAREVRLTGEGFFNVVKDTEKPFFVYGGDVVTKVLGTSFRVSAPEFAERIEVEVKTGKVSVYEDPSGASNGHGRDGNGVILTPNEKVQYYVEAGHWVTSLVDNPQPLTTDKDARTAFVFSGTPVKEVFQHIETSYHIDIIIENENAYTCTFTGDVSRMELYKMLQVICRSINATFYVKGTKILVSGSGCEQ